MIRVVKLTNRIGYAMNLFGFKISLVFGHREWYWEDEVLKTRNHRFQRSPNGWIRQGTCGLSSVCMITHSTALRVRREVNWFKRSRDLRCYFRSRFYRWIHF